MNEIIIGNVSELSYAYFTAKLRVVSREKNHLSYDVASESVITPCIKNDNPLVD